MVLFKINGERNSGTTFLTKILEQNGFPIYVHNIQKNICYHWIHGTPHTDIKLLDNKVIDIFIFRKLEDWLVSMYYNSYHLEKIDDFSNFLSRKQQSIEKYLLDYKTNEYLNNDDNNKTIFEIRYYKFKKIMEYKQNNNFIIFVNLEFLQDEKNLLDFLQKLNNIYMDNSIKNNYITQIPHTKINTKLLNRIYDINSNDYEDIIKKYKNEEIETFINNITFNIL
jgi:hypothetical protein